MRSRINRSKAGSVALPSFRLGPVARHQARFFCVN
jgi:hypothetical protein